MCGACSSETPPALTPGPDGGSKLDKARDRGVPVLDEAALGRLLEGAALEEVVEG
jgi:NAD-dependent DNA ligase